MNGDKRLEDLNRTINQARKSPFYSKRILKEALSSFEELKELPFTTKDDIRQNSPFGLVSVPEAELFQYHETFGTTGTPASVWLTREDVDDISRRVNLRGIEFTEKDIVLVRFPYAISTIAHFTHAAAQSKNACIIPASSRTTVTPYSRVVNLMKKLKVTVLACLALEGLLIGETAELMGLKPAEDFSQLRAIYTAGELMTARRRRILEEMWRVPVIDNYGMTEIGPAVTECKHGNPHPISDSFIYEILDDEFRREVKPGETGNLVITTLNRRAVPLIRYMTGDRARVVKSYCRCGEKEYLQIRGRQQDVLSIKGQQFDLWDMEEIVSHVPFCRLWAGGMVDGKLEFIIEQTNEGDSLSPKIIKTIKDKYSVEVNIKVVPKGTLYDRSKLLAVGEVGKPKYIYSEEEMRNQAYLK